MPQVNLLEMKLENISELDDGRVSIAFMHELKRAVLDCLDRPGDSTARKVSLEFELKPLLDETSRECEVVNGSFRIKSKVPERKTKNFQFSARKSGHLAFNKHSPQQVNQHTIFDEDEAE